MRFPSPLAGRGRGGAVVAGPDRRAYTLSVSAIEPPYRYIVRTPGVRGGNAHVEGTRIGVHDVLGLLQNGETVDSVIANCFLHLTRAQVIE